MQEKWIPQTGASLLILQIFLWFRKMNGMECSFYFGSLVIRELQSVSHYFPLRRFKAMVNLLCYNVYLIGRTTAASG